MWDSRRAASASSPAEDLYLGHDIHSSAGLASCARGVPHDAQAWLQRMSEAGSGTRHADMRWIRRLRVLIQHQTQHMIDTGAAGGAGKVLTTVHRAGFSSGPAAAATPVGRGGGADGTSAKKQRVSTAGAAGSSGGGLSVTVAVASEDCLVAAQGLLAAGCASVAVLNMANATSPGGGFRHGMGAQEENLHRRSDLVRHLADYPGPSNYPIPRAGVLYSPRVTVLRGPEADGYPQLETPFEVAVISCAALAGPTLVHDPAPRSGGGGAQKRMSGRDTAVASAKIRCIVETARHHGHDGLVLCALGCGAFQNPPHQVARLFRDALEAPPPATAAAAPVPPLRVTFAILDDHNAKKAHNPDGNFAPFQHEFGS